MNIFVKWKLTQNRVKIHAHSRESQFIVNEVYYMVGNSNTILVRTKYGCDCQTGCHGDSEVQQSQSSSVATVVESFKKNGVGLKGIITTPSSFKGGVLQTLNMKIRSELLLSLWSWL